MAHSTRSHRYFGQRRFYSGWWPANGKSDIQYPSKRFLRHLSKFDGYPYQCSDFEYVYRVLGGAGLVVDVVAADQSLDSGEQFRVGKRFAQIVVSPHGKSSV